MPSRRNLNLLLFAFCAALMGYALYAQYALQLAPCPLCVFQRLAVIATGVVCLIAALHNPGITGARIYALLILLAAGSGAFVAGRHVWLQNLPPEKVPACGPGLDFMLESFPVLEVLQMVLSGSGECATVDWSLFGLSMPAWVLIALLATGLAGILNNLRRY